MRHQQLQRCGFFRTSRGCWSATVSTAGADLPGRVSNLRPSDTLKSGLIAPWDPRNHRISQDLTGEGTSS